MQNDADTLAGFDVAIRKIDVDEHQRELERELLLRELDRQQTVESRKRTIIESVKRKLAQGVRVTITDEMDELGLRGEILQMAMQADLFWRLNSRLFDGEDDD